MKEEMSSLKLHFFAYFFSLSLLIGVFPLFPFSNLLYLYAVLPFEEYQ